MVVLTVEMTDEMLALTMVVMMVVLKVEMTDEMLALMMVVMMVDGLGMIMVVVMVVY